MSPKPIGLNTVVMGLTDSAAVTVVAMWSASGERTSTAVFRYASGISTGSSPNSTASMSRYSRSRSANWCCKSEANSRVARCMASVCESLEFLNQAAGGADDMLISEQSHQAVDEGHVDAIQIGIQLEHGGLEQRLVVGGHVVRIDFQIERGKRLLVVADFLLQIDEAAQHVAHQIVDFGGVDGIATNSHRFCSVT